MISLSFLFLERTWPCTPSFVPLISMRRVVRRSFFVLVFTVILVVQQRAGAQDSEDEGLKRMLTMVTPLMAILRRSDGKESGKSDEGYSGGGCCDKKTDYLGIISLIALSLLGLFMVQLLSSTRATGRKKRDQNGLDEDPHQLDLAHHYLDDEDPSSRQTSQYVWLKRLADVNKGKMCRVTGASKAS